ncbi:MAG: hypothetical protein ACRDQ5_17070 [Sciscionella sp.]
MIEPVFPPTSELPFESSFSSGALDSSASIHRTRAIGAGLPRSISTTLAESSSPPPWLNRILDEVRLYDEDFILSPRTVQRLVAAIVQLPTKTARPEVGVGDDGTIGLEWDFNDVHLEIYVSNEPSEDELIVDVDGSPEIIEVPLFPSLPKVAKFFGIFSK